MNPRQRAFADEYIKTRNATRAYMSAYPDASEATAGRNGHALLKNTEISAYIDQRLEQMSSSRIADAAEIMEFLTSVIRGEKGETLIDNRGSEHEVPGKLSDRLSASRDLAKMLGVDKKAEGTDGGGGVTIVDDV